MPTGTLSPVGRQQFFTDAGAPLAGGKLYFYASGTSTPATVYQDSALATPHASPVVLDAAGRATVYLAAASLKLIVKTAGDVTMYTVDPVEATNLGTSGLGEIFHFGGQSSTPVTGTTYPTGATLDKLHPGTGVYSEDSANIPAGTYVLEGTGVVASGTTLTIALVNLSDGAPDTPIAAIEFQSLTGGRDQSTSITFAASGAAKSYGVKAKVDTGSGFVWGINLRRTA